MQPLTPAQKRTLADDTGADPAEVDEYDARLAERFTEDPDHGPRPRGGGVLPGDPRLDELTRKLFPGGIRQH